MNLFFTAYRIKMTGIGIFTAIFAAGYAVVWLFIYLSIKAKTDWINKKLQEENA